ncbi:MAG TPA: cell division protein FtsH, partial [Myxococcaceae bacterium]|nr:cell division protein FtsH [Myxococcaceae bacterium]
EIILGHLSTGAADDLSKVTDIARSMVTRYGMLRELGPLAYETEPNGFLAGIPQAQRRLYSEETAREIDLAVREIVQNASERCRTLLAQRRQTLEKAARLLLEKETLTDVELKPLFDEARTEAVQAVPRVVSRS